MLEDDEMLECYRHCAQIGGQAMVHAENGHIIDRESQGSKFRSISIK